MQHNNVDWQACSGVYSTSYKPVKYFFAEKDSNIYDYKHYKNSYLIVMREDNPELLHIDDKGETHSLFDQYHAKYAEFKSMVNEEFSKRPLTYLDNHCDVYILPTLHGMPNESFESQLLHAISSQDAIHPQEGNDIKIEEARVAFVLYQNDFYYVDKRTHTVQKLVLSLNDTEDIKKAIGAETNLSVDSPMQYKRLVPHEIQKFILTLLNQLGCDVFLMPTPNDGTLKPSDANHLYLYRNENELIYKYENEIKVIAESELSQHRNALNEGFKQNKLLEKCKDTKLCSAILNITANRNHTHLSPYISIDTPKAGFNLIIPNQPIHPYLNDHLNKKISNLLHENTGHTHGQYNLYKAEIMTNTDQYTTPKGDTIAGEFKTLKELSDESTGQSLLKAVQESLGNEVWYKDQFLTIAAKLNSTDTKVNILLALLIFLTKQLSSTTPSSSHRPLSTNEMHEIMRKTITQIHTNHEVNPRCGKVYGIRESERIKVLLQGESNTRQFEKQLNKSPPDVVNAMNYIGIWIVSDIDPADVSKNKNQITNMQDHHSFICFSRYDALILVEKLKQFHQPTKQLLQTQPYDVKSYDGNTLSDYVRIQSAKLLDKKLRSIEDELNKLRFKQNEHIEQYSQSSSELAKPWVESQNKGVLKFSEYIHFVAINEIYAEVTKIQKLLNNFISGETIDNLDDINQALINLNQLCLKYINSHPYHDPQNDAICKAVAAIEECKKQIPSLLQEEVASNNKSLRIQKQASSIKSAILNKCTNDNDLKDFISSYMDDKMHELKSTISYRGLPPSQQARSEKLLYSLINKLDVKKVKTILQEYGNENKNACRLVLRQQLCNREPTPELSLADLYDLPNITMHARRRDMQYLLFSATKNEVPDELQRPLDHKPSGTSSTKAGH